jgi:phosphinothricin acetyltransferase
MADIRAARDTDFATIAAITNHYIATTAIHFAYEPLTVEDMLASWHDSREKFPWFVAVDGDRVCGYAKAGTWRDRSAYAWTTEIGVYIAHDAHRRGYARVLYTELLAELGRRGFHTVIAGIVLPNDASIALHLGFGFEPAGVVRDAGYKHGTWHDIAFYQKHLTASAS